MKEGGYKRLFERTSEYVQRVRNPETRDLWSISRAKLSDGWDLRPALEQVRTAEKAGWHVRLVADTDGLRAVMVRNPGNPPV
jgi:hypothetical protein